MAEGREVSAWLNASKMSGCKYMFVEGISDECFWKKYINKDVIRIQQVRGWENVVECVRAFNKESLDNRCIGIIDSDFESIYQYKSVHEVNIVITDFHDLEMILYKSEALDSALKALDKKNKLKEQTGNILNYVFSITDRIGYLRLTSLRNNFGLVFKKENKDHEFELPKYEKVIDSKNGAYDGDEKLIQYIYSFSNSRLPIDKIKHEFYNMSVTEYPSEHLSNGHDVSYVMQYVLRRKYGLNEKHITADIIDIALFSAYNMNLLKQTVLYESLNKWAVKYGYNIFLT